MLATVPSLNVRGGNHRIVIDTRDGYEVFDPNLGHEEREVYDDKSLVTWSELTVVSYCF
jgi:hypothetical protein